jgi:hypothetical protein
MELDIIKQTGNGTIHQLYKQVRTPYKNKQSSNMQLETRFTPNQWFDQLGIRYEYFEDSKVLEIDFNKLFTESILNYINSIPNDLGISIIFNFYNNEDIQELNSVFNSLSRIYTNKPIIIDVNYATFDEGINLEIEHLPSNVRISNLYFEKGIESVFHGENSFDWWGLKLSEDDFKLYLTKLTPKSRERACQLREIAFNTYKYLFKYNIENLSVQEKGKLVFDWCMGRIDNRKGYIAYDFEHILSDGRLDLGHEYSRDAIETFNRKKGVCAGRSRLLKVMLNNYYMRVPCFLVHGMWGELNHEWNEIITEDGESVMFDMSQLNNLSDIKHDDYELSKPKTRFPVIKKLPGKRLPKIKNAVQ